MHASPIQKTPGKVIPMRRFETTLEEEVERPNRPTTAQRREDFLSEQIVVTLRNLLESLRPLKS